MQSNKPKSINTDVQEIEDILEKIEVSYQIKFQSGEMSHLKTFGQISSHIISKIELEDINNCTSQQAFYKLREAIAASTGISEKDIRPDTDLEMLFPRKNRIKDIKSVEQKLGFQLKALKVSSKVFTPLIILLLVSFTTLFFNGKYGLCGILGTIILMKISDKMAKEFEDKTVGDLVKNMMLENYLLSRSDPNTINRAEIRSNIEALFIKEIGLADEFDELTDDVIIVY